MPTEDWHKHRGAFNHDWLKNRYMQNIGKFINVLDRRVVDRGWIKIFLDELLPEWETQRIGAHDLIVGFVSQTSPRQLFENLPLSRCCRATKLWLEDIAELLWIHRYGVKDWTNKALNALQTTDSAYTELMNVIRELPKAQTIEQFGPCRKHAMLFRDCCQNLATVLSEFPRGVL